jgi:UDP-N-acetylmuramyl tripeptide synthase
LANAAIAVVAAMKLGVEPSVAAHASEGVASIAGRYQTVAIGRARVRLLLAKNPAGWHELLTMIDGEDHPVLLAINARIADGRDPSWLWDVEFERLRDRKVIAAGERAADLAVRLHYAEVDCEVWSGDVLERLRTLGWEDQPVMIDVLANYTVFADLTRQLKRSA